MIAIDRALTENFGNRPEIWVSIDQAWTQRIRTEIMRRYTGAGWNVRYVSDQRDGNAQTSAARGGDMS